MTLLATRRPIRPRRTALVAEDSRQAVEEAPHPALIAPLTQLGIERTELTER
jgi:hypothetical protein